MARKHVLSLCFVVMILVFVGKTEAECGDEEADWEEIPDFQIRGFAEPPVDHTVEECKAFCQDIKECLSFEYYVNAGKCSISEKNQYSDGVLTEVTADVTYYGLTCREDTYSSGDSEEDDDDDDEDGILEIFEDNPEYAALVGMGALVLILLLTAIIAICVLSPKRDDTMKPV